MLLFLFIWFLLCGICSLVLWEKTKTVLHKEGKEYNEFFYTGINLDGLKKVIETTDDPGKKASYQKLFWIQLLLIPIYFLGGFIVIVYF